MPKPKNLKEDTQAEIKKYFPNLTPCEISQLADDIIDKLGWEDVIKGKDLFPGGPPDRIDNLTEEQKKALNDFLNRLPNQNNDVKDKIRNRLNF